MKNNFNPNNFQELSKNEALEINGGGPAWKWLGQVVRSFQCFIEGAKEGGYAACKCS